MTGHFTTLDKCERWASITGAPEFMRVRFSFSPTNAPTTFTSGLQGHMYSYRMYKLESIDYSKGLAEYVEVYNG